MVIPEVFTQVLQFGFGGTHLFGPNRAQQPHLVIQILHAFTPFVKILRNSILLSQLMTTAAIPLDTFNARP